MKILIDGANTINQGAELMLYSVVQEVSERFPDTKIVFNDNAYGIDNRKASDFNIGNLISKRWFHNPFLAKIIRLFRIDLIFFKCTGHLLTWLPMKGIDYLIDISGYYFTDYWHFTDKIVKAYDYYLSNMKKNGTKIVYLPQAFGPLNNRETQKMVLLIAKYADCVFARDEVSFHTLLSYIAQENLFLFPDFTNNIIGKANSQFEYLKNYVCIIPNMRMLDQKSDDSNYFLCFYQMISYCHNKGHRVFILCHDKGDIKLCMDFGEKMKIPVIIGKDALETKSIISLSYVVVSSRYHGLASALNSAVPCLATSWSQKYEALMADYCQEDKLIDVGNYSETERKLDEVLNKEMNLNIRQDLSNKGNELKKEL